MKSRVLTFRLNIEQIEKLKVIAGRHNLSPQGLVKHLVLEIIGDKVKEASSFQEEMGKILADKTEEWSVFHELVADTTQRIQSQVAGQGQLFVPEKKNVEGRKSKKQKQT